MDILVTLLRSPDSVTAVVIVSVSEMGTLSAISREGSAGLDSLGRKEQGAGRDPPLGSQRREAEGRARG